MRLVGVGAVLVTKKGKPCGSVTARDIVVRRIAERRTPNGALEPSLEIGRARSPRSAQRPEPLTVAGKPGGPDRGSRGLAHGLPRTLSGSVVVGCGRGVRRRRHSARSDRSPVLCANVLQRCNEYQTGTRSSDLSCSTTRCPAVRRRVRPLDQAECWSGPPVRARPWRRDLSDTRNRCRTD
jgi:hypothetical protein